MHRDMALSAAFAAFPQFVAVQKHILLAIKLWPGPKF